MVLAGFRNPMGFRNPVFGPPSKTWPDLADNDVAHDVLP